MKNKFLGLLIAMLAAVPIVSADGMLDPSFGNGGLVTTHFPYPPGPTGAGAYSLVVLPDGRAVAAGVTGDIDEPDMGAARYLASGALDTTFSGDGIVIVDCLGWFGGVYGSGAALLQADGRLVLVGSCPGNQLLTLARLNVDGSLDPSFGTGGQVFTPFTDGVWAAAAILQPDGRIVAVGSGCTGIPCLVALKAARYNPDGSLDPSFGTGGKLTLPLAQGFEAQDAVLQPDGKLVIVGNYGPGDFGLVRLLPNGTLDPSFDGDGVVTSDFGAAEEGRSVILLGDGRIVLGGRRAFDLALVRYLPDGSLDTTFGTGGLATANSGANNGLGQVTLLPNGKLFVAGSILDAQGYAVDFLLARFHPDGALDTSFGASGFIGTDFNGQRDACRAVAVAGPDLILTAGWTAPAQGFGDFALARYITTTPVELLTFGVE